MTSILDQPTNPPQSYTFASGSIEGFIANQQSPIQEMAIQEPSDFEPESVIEEIEPETEKEKIDIQMTAAAARSTGTLLAAVTDSAIPALLCTIAGDDNVDQYKASESEKEDLTAAFTEYSRQKGMDIPPGVALLMTIGAIYGLKVPVAIRKRKERSNEKVETHKS